MINLVALPCLCVDVFDGTDELYAGGEALILQSMHQNLRSSMFQYWVQLDRILTQNLLWILFLIRE